MGSPYLGAGGSGVLVGSSVLTRAAPFVDVTASLSLPTIAEPSSGRRSQYSPKQQLVAHTQRRRPTTRLQAPSCAHRTSPLAHAPDAAEPSRRTPCASGQRPGPRTGGAPRTRPSATGDALSACARTAAGGGWREYARHQAQDMAHPAHHRDPRERRGGRSPGRPGCAIIERVSRRRVREPLGRVGHAERGGRRALRGGARSTNQAASGGEGSMDEVLV